MAVNKVVINTPTGEQVLIDLTMLTVTPETLAEGVIAINAAGELIVGTGYSSDDVVTHTNQVPVSINTDGTIYNGTGYKEGYRLNSSGTETATAGCVASGFIPYNGEVIRVWGATKENVGSTGNYIGMYDSSFAKINVLSGSNAVSYGAAWGALDGKYMLTVDPDVLTNEAAKTALSNAAYIRVSIANGTGKDFVATLDEPIEV